MRSLALAPAILFLLSSLNLVRANDTLFSEVAMESVFEKNPTEHSSMFGTQSGSTRQPGRITGATSLSQVIREADLKCTVKGEQVNLVLEAAGWRFPVTLTVDVERERILCELTLISIKNNANLDPNSLIQLMAAGDASRSAFFAYSPTHRCIQLRGSISNRHVNSNGLVVELERLGKTAASQSQHWNRLGSEGAKGQPGQNPTSTGSTDLTTEQQKTAQDHSLEGRWSASLSNNEAFALQFDRGNRFALVYMKDGKSNVSTGNVVRESGDLVFKDDGGTTLTCGITWRDSNAFQLVIKAANGQPSMRMELKKR